MRDHTIATTQQMLMSDKCSSDIMIIVVGKAATAVESTFTVKLNYSLFCGSILMRFKPLELLQFILLAVKLSFESFETG